jgi:hypothetical protein
MPIGRRAAQAPRQPQPRTTEKLCIEEFIALLRLAREVGFHQAKHWIDDELGYQPTPPQDPKIERDRLADELARAADHFKSLERAVERLGNGTEADD